MKVCSIMKLYFLFLFYLVVSCNSTSVILYDTLGQQQAQPANPNCVHNTIRCLNGGICASNDSTCVCGQVNIFTNDPTKNCLQLGLKICYDNYKINVDCFQGSFENSTGTCTCNSGWRGVGCGSK